MNDATVRVVLCHSVPGRMRVRVPFRLCSPDSALRLQHSLEQRPEVQGITLRPITGSVILLYDSTRITPEQLLHVLSDALVDSSSNPRDTDGRIPSERRRTEAPSTTTRDSFARRLTEVVALTGFVAYTFVRGVVLGSPLAQGPFSLVAGVSAVGALPLLRRAVGDLRQGRPLSLFPFLAGTVTIAIVVGEALTALEVIWILRVGMLLEEYVADRSRRAIREALQVSIRNAFVLVDGAEVEVPVTQLRVGDLLAVHAGERIAADGVVVRGDASVDEALISGRSQPEQRDPGDRVFAGTIVEVGSLVVGVERAGQDTYIARTLEMVEEALRNRAPAERRADVLAARLVRLGSVVTLATLVVTGDLMRTFTVLLVVSCPCATVLAASTAVTAALANAARNAVLVKGGLYLERIGEADSFCFDKTGTVTSDLPHVVAVVPRAPWQRSAEVLALAAAAETHGQHPVARAIVGAARAQGVTPTTDVIPEFVLGRGARARVDQDTVLVGNLRFMEEHGVRATYFRGRSQALLQSGNTVLYVARNGKLQGMIALATTVRSGSEATLGWLRKDGVSELRLITGDEEPVARSVGRALGFDSYDAPLLPDEKADLVDGLVAGGKRVVVVGDGVNDALALSKASVGVAMGAGGAEAAIEAADIALVDSELERLVMLRQLSHRTLRVIEQNYWMATGTNLFGVAMAVTGHLAPVMGGLLHIAHTTAIMANSSRLLRWGAPGLTEGHGAETLPK